jgi:hypothetical protein
MSWILETIISEIYDSYEALPGGREPIRRGDDGEPLLGNIEKARNADCPRVIWVCQGGNFGDPKLAASAAPVDPTAPAAGSSPHYQALARFWVWIWQVDLETCWNVMVDLIAATRATVYGPNMGPQNFQCPTEIEGREMHRGALIVLDMVLSVPIPRDGTVAVEEVVIATTTTDVKLRNDLLALETDPVPDADIEIVIVTDP